MADFKPGDIVRINGGPLKPFIGLRCVVVDGDFDILDENVFLQPLEDRPLAPAVDVRTPFFWCDKWLEASE
jgi:hypothetical protein